jgi:hypothetical protein
LAGSKVSVVISQAQGKHPVRRQLEETLAARLLAEPGVDVSIVPHLYDMPADHPGLLHLRAVGGPLVVLSWLYPRAAHWLLDRQGIAGREGRTLLLADEPPDEAPPRQGIGPAAASDRPIYCIDLRARNQAEPFVEEVRRIVRERSQSVVSLTLLGTPATAGPATHGQPSSAAAALELAAAGGSPRVIAEETPLNRRWYPVIDYSRCTNCMECVDFCLFGVYGLDTLDRILVEAQDNCKQGCPACSRVCPENAIIFPQHKSPGIAGADGEVAGLKIDLTKLFGGGDPLQTAVAERDAELIKDGRAAVGESVGLPKRRATPAGPRDALDDLMDGLNDF